MLGYVERARLREPGVNEARDEDVGPLPVRGRGEARLGDGVRRRACPGTAPTLAVLDPLRAVVVEVDDATFVRKGWIRNVGNGGDRSDDVPRAAHSGAP